MKHFFTFIVGVILLTTSAMTVAAETPEPFNPRVHTKENPPTGIAFVETGKVDIVTEERVVVDDGNFPFSTSVKIFTRDGLTTPRKNLKAGQTVDLYANDRREAVYIVIK